MLILHGILQLTGFTDLFQTGLECGLLGGMPILHGILQLTGFTDLFQTGVEYGLLGRRSMHNPTDWWPRIVDG